MSKIVSVPSASKSEKKKTKSFAVSLFLIFVMFIGLLAIINSFYENESNSVEERVYEKDIELTKNFMNEHTILEKKMTAFEKHGSSQNIDIDVDEVNCSQYWQDKRAKAVKVETSAEPDAWVCENSGTAPLFRPSFPSRLVPEGARSIMRSDINEYPSFDEINTRVFREKVYSDFGVNEIFSNDFQEPLVAKSQYYSGTNMAIYIDSCWSNASIVPYGYWEYCAAPSYVYDYGLFARSAAGVYLTTDSGATDNCVTAEDVGSSICFEVATSGGHFREEEWGVIGSISMKEGGDKDLSFSDMYVVEFSDINHRNCFEAYVAANGDVYVRSINKELARNDFLCCSAPPCGYYNVGVKVSVYGIDSDNMYVFVGGVWHYWPA